MSFLESDSASSTAEALRSHVEALTALGSRFWKTPGYAQALDVAEERFKSWGYDTRRQNFNIGQTNSSDDPIPCYNLIADRLIDEEPPSSILGAHLDSVASGAGEGQPAPGADDNASGCAIVLETAKRLAEEESNRSRRYVLFGAEEIGMIGSGVYVARMEERERTALRRIWILDQVGLDTRSQPTLKLEGRKIRSGAMMNHVERYAESAGLLTERTYKPYGSDHMPFLNAKYSTLLLIQPDDEEDPLNHTAEDRPERLNYEYMARILKLLTLILPEEERMNSRFRLLR